MPLRRLFLLGLAALFALPTLAHPEFNEPLLMVINKDAVLLRAQAHLMAISLVAGVSTTQWDKPDILNKAASDHGQYLLQHFRLSFNGQALSGKLVQSKLNDFSSAKAGEAINDKGSTYDLQFNLPSARPAGILQISHDVLKSYNIGQHYNLQYQLPGASEKLVHTLDQDKPLTIDLPGL